MNSAIYLIAALSAPASAFRSPSPISRCTTQSRSSAPQSSQLSNSLRDLTEMPNGQQQQQQQQMMPNQYDPFSRSPQGGPNMHEGRHYSNDGFDPFGAYGGGRGMARPSPGGGYHPDMTMMAPGPMMDDARRFDRQGSRSGMGGSADGARNDQTHAGFDYSSRNGMYGQGGQTPYDDMWMTGGFEQGPQQFEQGPPQFEQRPSPMGMGDMGGMGMMYEEDGYHGYGGFEEDMMGRMGP